MNEPLTESLSEDSPRSLALTKSHFFYKKITQNGLNAFGCFGKQTEMALAKKIMISDDKYFCFRNMVYMQAD